MCGFGQNKLPLVQYDAACLENEQNKSEQDKGIEKNAALAQQVSNLKTHYTVTT